MSQLQIVYVSSAVVRFQPEDLHLLVTQAAAHNRVRGVTGLLLYHNDSFIQALEGPTAAVLETFESIRRDPRHRGVLRVLNCPIAEREFGDWDLGLIDSRDLSSDARRAIEPVIFPSVGLEDSLLVSGRAHRLMRTFMSAAS